MATVFIPALLRDATGGRDVVTAEGATIRLLIENLEVQFSGIKARLLTGDDLRRGLAVAVGGRLASRDLDHPIPPDAEVHFVPALSGG